MFAEDFYAATWLELSSFAFPFPHVLSVADVPLDNGQLRLLLYSRWNGPKLCL